MKYIKMAGCGLLRRTRQRGFGLVGVTALLAVLAASAMAVYLSSQSYRHQHVTMQEVQALHWADGLLKDYAAKNGRLPCSAPTRLGTEDCTNGGDWLPVQTLLNQTTVSTRNLTSTMLEIRYMPNRGGSGIPDLTTRPAGQFVPAVGLITPVPASGNQRTGETGTDITPMGAYKAPAPSVTDFCQQLQNVALGPIGALAIAPVTSVVGSNSPVSHESIDPWSATTQSLGPTAQAYQLTGPAQTLTVSAADVYRAFQCEALSASLSMMATTASFSEPGGAVLGLRQALISGPSGWADSRSQQFDWGSYSWMVHTLIPQIVAEQWFFSLIRVWQTAADGYKLADTALAAGIPLFTLQALAAHVFYQAAMLRRLLDLGAQVIASVNDTAYLGAYKMLLDEIQGIQPWGLPDPVTQISPADDAVQKAVALGATWAITTAPF
ncbi:hypothetical protein WJ36_13885 [Burkholderia ubonensis]|uniref:hypothetical protein n=1 Tax=Burkholderia ubonensis TaxID=101571 RepID=UPI00075406D8|nr:hypothetical protein [Burkholderia ubonensis]KVG81684.1 hypothetical protein WJ36_13885 [Burkholderia ubonensis]